MQFARLTTGSSPDFGVRRFSRRFRSASPEFTSRYVEIEETQSVAKAAKSKKLRLVRRLRCFKPTPRTPTMTGLSFGKRLLSGPG